MRSYTIAILFGGCSSEYAVSLQSASAVARHLDRKKYIPVLIGITRAGEWFRFYGGPEKIADDTWCNEADCVRAVLAPCRKTHGLLELGSDGVSETRLDAAMPVLHGKNGEDGTVQGLLELAGIPIVGCKALSSALCMDKDRAHKLAHMAGVKVPRSFVVDGRRLGMDSLLSQAAGLEYPLFVKPVHSGSSYGISKVAGSGGLLPAIQLALQHDSSVLVEQAVPGFEVGCALLGAGDNLVVGQVDEIELADGFFDYAEKYTLKSCKIHVPARISPKKSDAVVQAAKTIYTALGCSGFARVDMFLRPDGEIVFNEVNTIPGFTAHSRYPNMLKGIGMTLEQVISSAIEVAVTA